MSQPDARALDAYLAACREEWRALGLPDAELPMPPAAIEAAARRLAKAWVARAGWTRLSEALPPADGTPFELRLDGEPARYLCAWRRQRLCMLVIDDVGPDVAKLRREDCVGWFRQHPGQWRLLPDDGPPESGG